MIRIAQGGAVTHGSAPRGISDSASLGLERLATVSGYGTGEAVYRYGDRLEFWYGVTAGAARKFSLTPDGCRRIVDFLLPGDLFGFGMCSRHRFSVEALAGGTAIARYRRVDAEQLADSNPDIGRRIRVAAFDSINRMQSRMVLLGRASAVEKLSIFLLEMADRNRAASTDMIVLPMSRYDIADYLAIAVETVSRALTQLRCEGVIRLAGLRSVRVSDRQLLRRIADKIE
jgi:CRP-like cAMP-binding protein